MDKDLFPLRPDAQPMIYAYEDSNPEYKGLLKVGYSAVDVEQRVAQQYPTKRPDGRKPYRIVFKESAMYSDGGNFSDHDIHRALKERGYSGEGGEWFRCSVSDLKATYIAVRDKIDNIENRTRSFTMRPEQEEAVSKTIEYFKSSMKEKTKRTAKFLWNAKMRFGKTFASYQLAKRMNFTKILILTFKPAVQSAWEEDIKTHIDFEGWQFISRKTGLIWEKAVMRRHNTFFQEYKINICAGSGAGIGVDALDPVEKSMGDPLKTKTITLTCGKLTTGVTVKPWTGIFMLRNLSSPETYFQAAFRVQSPWEVEISPGKKEIMKKECYIFDFALDRALKQIADYSCRLDVNESNPEKKVAEFIKFLPVIAFDGSTMKQINASDVLDISMAGTSATLLARRWESALLVNVDNDTLARLMANADAMLALENIEGFRSLNLNNTFETIINLSEKVKKAKTKDVTPSVKDKKELTEEEKEYKSKRKMIQEKLIKFATRIPLFMYLSDYREYSLKDVIQQLEKKLFTKVTGLAIKDFELLVSLGVFNGPLMNDAVYKFKRYEDSSLSYTDGYA